MFLFVSRAPYAAKQLFTTNTFPKDMYLLEHLLVQSLSSQQWLPAQVLYMRTMHTPQELHGSIWLTLHIKSQTLSIDKLSGGQTTKSLSIDKLLVVGGTFFYQLRNFSVWITKIFYQLINFWISTCQILCQLINLWFLEFVMFGLQ